MSSANISTRLGQEVFQAVIAPDITRSCRQQLYVQSVSDCDKAWCPNQSLSYNLACLALAQPFSMLLGTLTSIDRDKACSLLLK